MVAAVKHPRHLGYRGAHHAGGALIKCWVRPRNPLPNTGVVHARPCRAFWSLASKTPAERWISTKQKAKIGGTLFGICLLLLDHSSEVPFIHRTQICVIPKYVEEIVSPVIRRSAEKRLTINKSPRAGDTSLREISTRLQECLGQEDWEPVIIEDGRRYAACGHNGAIYITRGLMNQCTSEDELAWALAHEIGHGIARHRWEISGRLSVYALIAPFLGVIPSTFITALYGLSWVRRCELEADELGLILMANAGYDPRAAVVFMQAQETMKAFAAPSSSAWKRLLNLPPLRRHPHISVRLQNMEKPLQGLFGLPNN